MRNLIAIGFALALTACGGGGYDHRMMVSLDATAPAEPGFDASITPPTADPVESVALQLRAPGDLMLQVPSVKNGEYAAAIPHLAEALKYPDRFKWAYVYDEMFWTSEGGIQIGLLEDQITAAALYVKAHGLKPVVSMLPEAILRPGFTLKNPQAFDVIAIDVYPSLGVDWNARDCTTNGNLYSTMLYCSIQRLRAVGYTGEVWFIYQAFGVRGDENLIGRLGMQRITIDEAPYMGVTGLVSFGYAQTPPDEPALYPGKGSVFDDLVNCRMSCGAIAPPSV